MIVRDLLASVCNQTQIAGSPFCPYCTGIYPAIALSFPGFLWVFRKGSRIPMWVLVVGGILLLGLMCVEFSFHRHGVGFLPVSARVAIGASNGLFFGVIGASFWTKLFAGKVSLRITYVTLITLGAVCFYSAVNWFEGVLFTGVFLRYFVANTLLVAALLPRKTVLYPVSLGLGLLLACVEWWVFHVTA